MTKTIGDYVQLVEEVYFEDGTVQKVGFYEGKWLFKTEYKRVGVSKRGYLLNFDYNENGQAINYKLYLNFAEMAADEVDFYLLSKVVAAINADYVLFLD